MVNLKDKLTLIIPVHVDHEDRVRNIRTTLSYIKHHFDVNIIISEQDTSSKLHDMCKEFKCRHIYNETADFFNKLKLVNIAAKEVSTPVISIYDADALVRPEQLEGATNAIVSGSAQMVYPYDGKFYDVPVRFFDNINDTKDLTNINLEECTLFNPHSVGGIVLFDREHFWKCGGGNENFKSVGYDDNEIDIRFRILGTKIMRTQWPLFHLNHTRVETSFNHNPHINFNRDYCMQITNMNRAQLLEHVDQWDWHKNNI